jgi:hypothetical protein
VMIEWWNDDGRISLLLLLAVNGDRCRHSEMIMVRRKRFGEVYRRRRV